MFEISPAEGNTPVSGLQEEGIEAKTFPVHFPTGKIHIQKIEMKNYLLEDTLT